MNDAVRIGADAVAVQVFVGGEHESRSVKNLTTLVDFERKAWHDMIEEGTPIPTPVDENQPRRLGVYEGGGYVDKGVYRPWPNCMMNNLHTIDVFCPVCTAAIQKQIDFLCR